MPPYAKTLRRALSALLLVFLIRGEAAQVNINGTVEDPSGTPVCAMVLASGQYMFSCDPVGEFNFNVYTRPDGTLTLFAFADGFYSKKLELNGGQSGLQVVLSAPGNELCTAATDAGCARMLIGNWLMYYTVGNTGFDPWYALATVSLDSTEEYFAWGLDEFGETAIGYYAEDNLWVIFDSGSGVNLLHAFVVEGDYAEGCTYQVSETDWSDCFHLVGLREAEAGRGVQRSSAPRMGRAAAPPAAAIDHARLVEVYRKLKGRLAAEGQPQ